MKSIGTSFKIAPVLIFVFVLAFVLWAKEAHAPDPRAYTTALANPSVIVGNSKGFITISPRSHPSSVGLLFYPGARVAPAAYLAKLAAIAAATNIQIVIGQPRLNLAVFSINQADEMRDALPGVEKWYVGGHSLGGAMACLYASQHPDREEGLMLFGTYCGSNISKTKLRVLSVTGGNDGLMTPEKVSQARSNLPASAQMEQVAGMNHTQFGNYGPQPGDRDPSIVDSVAEQRIVDAAAAFMDAETPHNSQ
jgi:hypothetical protein